MNRTYMENLIILDICREISRKLLAVIDDYPQFDEIIDYKDDGRRLLKVRYVFKTGEYTPWWMLPQQHDRAENFFHTAQMDDFGNLCWADGQAHMWNGYLPPHLADYGTRDLKNGEPFPYIHDMPTCH